MIGIGHYSRTGKDTLANFIIKKIGERRPDLRVGKKSLAWKLKDVCHQLYGWMGLREPAYYETEKGAAARDVKLQPIDKTPVEIWVDFGTKAVRDNVYADTWLDYFLHADHDLDVIICPDVRFPNEFSKFQDQADLLIKVVRQGYGPRNTVADRALVGETRWDYVIGGKDGMKELEEWADRIADNIVLLKPLPWQSDQDKARQLNVEVL